MPKLKTRKSASKRIKKTGTGKYMHFRSGARHLKRKKNSKRRRRLRQSALVKPSERNRLRAAGL